MSLTVATLVAEPLIRTRLLAGAAGADRVVSWAHTCELADPWNWLGSGDLLMSDGYGFPATPEAQVSFIENLAGVDLAGLALAEGFETPTITDAVLARADALGFPLLTTARDVPFVSMARLVAENSSAQSTRRLSRVLRLYDVFRRLNLVDRNVDGLLDDLADQVQADLHVISPEDGTALMPTKHELASGIKEGIVSLLDRHEQAPPAFSRIVRDGVAALITPLPLESGALLVAVGRRGELPDVMLAQHVAMITAIDVERREVVRARDEDRRAALGRGLKDGSIASDLALRELSAFGLGAGPWVVTAWSTRRADGALARKLRRWGEPSLHFVNDERHYLIARAQLPEMRPGEACVGVSQPVLSVSGFPDGARQSGWALAESETAARAPVVYGEPTSGPGPRTVAEGEALVRRLLGPIVEYDNVHDSKLTLSLEAFFAANRSWQRGARMMNIHKQTLAYRVKKVEELTGLDLQDFASQAEYFRALQAWRVLGGETWAGP